MKKTLYVMAWGLIPLMYLSWCFSTISYIHSFFLIVSGVIGIVGGSLFNLLANKSLGCVNIQKDIYSLDTGIIIGGILFLLTIKNEYSTGNRWIVYLATLLWVALSAYRIREYLTSLDLFSRIQTFLKEKVFLIMLLVVIPVLSLDSNMAQFKWDGLLYYNAVKEARLFSISNVAICGHISMCPGVIYRLFASLFGDVVYGMIFANIAVFDATIVAFYRLVELIIPKRNKSEYVLATACFSFSPFLLGMVNYFSTDWFSVCISVILLYFILSKRWIWATISACMFCMTKEPALIAYTGLCLGLCIVDIYHEKDLKNGIFRIFTTAGYYFLLIPYVLWIITYKILGKWQGGNGGFAFSPDYIARKLKVFLIFNFNWLIVAIILISLIALIMRHQLRECVWWLIPTVCSNAFLLLFNIMYNTANHARYIDSFISINLVLAVCMSMKAIQGLRKRVALYSILALISLLACFTSIDPVTKLFMGSIKVGEFSLFSTDSLYYGDSSIYNKQILWMERPISQAIADSFSDDSAIVMAIGDGSVYSFDGMSEMISMTGDIHKDTQFWDSDKACRVPYASEYVGDATPFILYHVRDGVPVDDIDSDNGKISVIYIKGINNYVISDDYQLCESHDYKYRGWNISRDVYARNGSDGMLQ